MTGIARDDLALDLLASGEQPFGDDEVLGLLAALRSDLEPVVVPLRRPRRRGALIALSAAAGLILGGITAGAVVNADQPGQLLYAAHKAVLGDPRSADRVTKLLDDAAEDIAKGDYDNARDRLAKAAERLGAVEDPAARAALRERLDRLTALAAAPVEEKRDDKGGDDKSGSDDSSGSGSSGSGSSGSSGSGSSGSSGSGSDDSSGSGSSGSGSSGSGSGSDDRSGSSGSGSSGSGSDDSTRSGSSGSGSDD